MGGIRAGSNAWKDSPRERKGNSGKSGRMRTSLDPEAAMAKGLADVWNALENSHCVVFTAPTGLGKSTRLPSFLADKDGNFPLKVACTQPRRMAAKTLARRVAADMNTNEMNGFVSYKVRDDNTVNPSTRLVFMTDGSLLMEAIRDGMLEAYSYVVVDEAHERSMDTEILLCLLKVALVRNKRLKVVIMSATLKAKTFTDYFPGSCLVEIHDVEKHHVQVSYLTETPKDVIHAAAVRAASIHLEEPDGHVLIFLPGTEEINSCVRKIGSQIEVLANTLNLNQFGKYTVLPLHSKLSPAEQDKALADPGFDVWRDEYGHNWKRPVRKIVCATNIAEASVTVPDLGYVIDSGLSKRLSYDWKTRQDLLVTGSIDHQSAIQRKGRTGRTRSGTNYRLYTEFSFENDMELSHAPDVVRNDPMTLILKLSSVGVKSVSEFDFIQKPEPLSILRGYSTLYLLGAFSPAGNVDLLSTIGKTMVSLPVSPEMAVSLDRANELGCVGFMMALVVMLQEGLDCFRIPRNSEDNVRYFTVHRHFDDDEGEHWRLVRVFLEFRGSAMRNGDGTCGRQWCELHFLKYSKLNAAMKMFDDLAERGKRFNWGVCEQALSDQSEASKTSFFKALVRGHFMQIAMKASGYHKGCSYTSLHDNLPVILHYTSQKLILADRTWVLYSTIFNHKNMFKIKCCSAIDPEWMLSEIGTFFVGDNFRPRDVKDSIDSLIESNRAG